MFNLRGFALALVLSATAAVGCSGCATGVTPTPTTPGTPPSTQIFGNCSSDAIRTSAEGIFGDVTTALATGNYEAEVTKLLVTYSAAEIGCAVDLIAAQFTKKAEMTNDTETQVVLVHARAWRQAHPAN